MSVAWNRDNGDDAWSHGGRSSGSDHHWQGQSALDSDEEEPLVEVLPDVIKGWLLLEKAGFDTLKKSIIQSDVKSQYTLLSLENSLRAHWKDEQIRRRDGESRAQANFEDIGSEEDAPQGVSASFFKEWGEEDVFLFQSAQRAEVDVGPDPAGQARPP